MVVLYFSCNFDVIVQRGQLYLPMLPFWLERGIFFVSSFWLPLCVCFYTLARSTMTSSVPLVTFCSRCPMRPSGAVPLITWAGCSRNVPCVDYVGPRLILSHSSQELTLRLGDFEAEPQPQHASCYAGADHMKQNHLSCVWCLPKSLCVYVAYEVNWILLWCYLKMTTEFVGSVSL